MSRNDVLMTLVLIAGLFALLLYIVPKLAGH
jgi:hypothetical protein